MRNSSKHLVTTFHSYEVDYVVVNAACDKTMLLVVIGDGCVVVVDGDGNGGSVIRKLEELAQDWLLVITKLFML